MRKLLSNLTHYSNKLDYSSITTVPIWSWTAKMVNVILKSEYFKWRNRTMHGTQNKSLFLYPNTLVKLQLTKQRENENLIAYNSLKLVPHGTTSAARVTSSTKHRQRPTSKKATLRLAALQPCCIYITQLGGIHKIKNITHFS